MKEIKYRVVIEPDEGGMWHGYVPALRGCHTCGYSVKETYENLKEAISLHIEVMLDCGQSLPIEQPDSDGPNLGCFQTIFLPAPI